LVNSYQELKEYELTHPEARVSGSEDEYVQMYMSNYVALYRVRSSTALAAIGGDQA
jgi:hypothetical protein